MSAKEIIHVIHETRRSHSAGPPYALFCRLEYQNKPAAKSILIHHQPMCNRKPHCGVPIVSAGMHDAGRL